MNCQVALPHAESVACAIRRETEPRPATGVDALAEKLDARLREWGPETEAEVRERVAEVVELANKDVLDLMRPRGVEQEVLDLLDEPTTR